MGTEFETDLSSALESLERVRVTLISRLLKLSAGDLERGRRGGWTVAQVLEHVIESERAYAAGVRLLRGLDPAPPAETDGDGTLPSFITRLERSRDALLSALAGVDEETFYRMGRLMHQDYSVMSVIENVELHDHEHLAQVEHLTAPVQG